MSLWQMITLATMSLHFSPRSANRIKKNARQARYRARQCRGEFCVTIPISAGVLDFLTRSRWLHEADMGKPKMIAEAVRSLLEVSAKI
jgi:hypothetical protein